MQLTYPEAQQIRAQRKQRLIARLTRPTQNVTVEQVAAEQAASTRPRSRAQKSE